MYDYDTTPFINSVNSHHNRYFTKEEKEEILYMYYEKKMSVCKIATELDSLPNHITWCLMRWKYKTKTNDKYYL